MMKVILLFLVATSLLKTTKGLLCWTCDGKRTLKQCHAQNGQMTECSNPTDVCQNDFRTAQGRPLITKGCKQDMACDAEVRQNKDKNQCGRTLAKKNLVCRCCCNTDACNSKASGCIPPPAPCKRINFFKNGRVFCPTTIEFGSSCSFQCNRGYKLVGVKKVVCKKDPTFPPAKKKGRWVPENLPECEKIVVKCNPPRTAPVNGDVSCKNTPEYLEFEEQNYEGSVCSYSCAPNYYVDGKKKTVCLATGKWSNTMPDCTRGKCKKPEEDVNRIEDCTDSYLFGSKCSFSCKKGYTLLPAETKQSACKQMGTEDEGIWTHKFPKCVRLICLPEHTDPLHGEVSCTNANNEDSVCTFVCDLGYDLDQVTKKEINSVCIDDGNGDKFGKWSVKAPLCSRIQCLPVLEDPDNGQLTCTDRNNFGSVCTTTCKLGYDLDDTAENELPTRCLDGGKGNKVGKWSRKPGTCTRITCQPPAKAPKKGSVTCTQENYKDSVCEYRCDGNYDLDGTTKNMVPITCLAGEKGSAEGRWSDIPPTCSIIKCPPPPKRDNLITICSTGMLYMRGTFCIIKCFSGYDMTGSSYMTCHDLKKDGDQKGEWSNKFPDCKLGACAKPKYDVATVVENCVAPKGYLAKEYRVGTECTYTCKSDAYYMVPNKDTRAVLSGKTISECDTEKQWTKKPPRCILKTCLPPFTFIENGFSPQCTDGNQFNSKCRFKCLPKYGLTHNRPLICTSDGDNDEYGKWSEEAPKCERSECDEYHTILHGRLNCSDGVKIGSICDLECIDRYIAKKYEQTICLPTARWSRRYYVCCVPCLFNKMVDIYAMFDSSAITSQRSWEYIVDSIETSLASMVKYSFDLQFAVIRYSDKVDEARTIPLERIRTREDLSEIVGLMRKMPITGTVSNTGLALTYVNDVHLSAPDKDREQFVIIVTSGKSRDDVFEISQKMRDRGFHLLVIGLETGKTGMRQLLGMAGDPRNLLLANTIDELRRIPEEINTISRRTGCTTLSKSEPCP